MIKDNIIKQTSILTDIRNLLQSARTNVLKQVNNIMVVTYFKIGKRIVEEEQRGNRKANYGEKLLLELSKKLTKEFGKGFSKRNLELIRKFYLTYSIAKSPISQLPKFNLTWTHYIKLMRIEDELGEVAQYPGKKTFYNLEK